MFREVDAVPSPREILVPEPGADDTDGTFVDESAELSALPQNVIVWFFGNGRHEFRSDIFLEDAFSGPFRVCPFRIFSSNNFLRFFDNALSADDVWDEEVARDTPLRVISERVIPFACHMGRREVQMGFFRSTGKRGRLVHCIYPGFGWARDEVSVTWDIESAGW